MTSFVDDRCLRGRRYDLEVSPRLDVTSKLNDSSIAFDRNWPVFRVKAGRLIGRSIRARKRNYRFPMVINLRALVLKIIAVCLRNVLISMLIARIDVHNTFLL